MVCNLYQDVELVCVGLSREASLALYIESLLVRTVKGFPCGSLKAVSWFDFGHLSM
ncbi:hypothetical protein Lalb_Chr22g0354851 [Lupinus albus]|uniref:Uncharacterized protein n=1 Tax=Lupinus albus TaxID=3870 RepID=A0A6A4NG25_LUPAL|nr:hypothetical protein Lalb_Chr22g0354851 [Lupinus albus]